MTYVKLGAVRAFPGARPDKAQAMKVLEEAAEVFGAWQALNVCKDTCGLCIDDTKMECDVHQCLLAEIADTVQACANLAAALGVTDLIEPEPERTCRNIAGEPFAGYREFDCSECGAHLEVDGDTDANLLVGGERPMPNYCPNCGAKVEVGK